MNLGTFYDRAARRYGDAEFITFYGRSFTFTEFMRQVDLLATNLRARGFGPGDFVHVLVQNSPETLMSYFAIQKIGAVAGPINGWWKAPEVEYLLNDSQGSGLIIEDQYLPLLDEIRDRCPHLKTIIEVGESPRPDHVAFSVLLDGEGGPVECQAEADDTAYIFYTSGTTGSPKGVLLSHRNVLADVEGITEALGIGEGENFLCFLPLFHVNAMLTCSFCLGVGSRIVLRKQFSATEFWPIVEEERINYWSAVPAVYQILLADKASSDYDLSSMKLGICGAAPLTEATMKSFEERFGIPILEGYGLTEATCVSTINPRVGERKVGSIGKALPGQQVRVVDEDGQPLGPDEPGEIVINGDVVMKGYYNRPDETAETIEDGWLHTGDVGVIDDDGFIFIVDRIKDMIIRGGENIYPKEIDNVLASHPKIQEAATVGVPDETMGEEVKSYVVALDDSLTEEEVVDHCRTHLAKFKVPKEIEILDEDFPRNAVGKILKKTLRDWARTGPRPKKRKKSEATAEHIFATMEDRVRPEGIKGVDANYGYIITGSGGGEWTVMVHDDDVKIKEGLHDPDVTTTVSAKDWIAITLGKLDGMTAFTSGKMKVEGDMQLLMKAPKFFEKYQPPKPEPEVTAEHIFATMEDRVRPEGIKGVDANYGYIITGSGGGEWTVMVHDDDVKIKEGLHDPDVTTTVSAKDWIAITLGKLDGMTAFTSGKMKVEGNLGLLQKATKFFKKYQPKAARAEAPPEELVVLKQVISVPQKFATGPVMGGFLKALVGRKILAGKCPSCGKHLLPAREVCSDCVEPVDELVEVGPEGQVTMYDITYYASPDPLTGEARETPYISAHFLLDGCKEHETFWHEVNPAQINKLHKGARVRPVWNEERRGAITDIKYFEIID